MKRCPCHNCDRRTITCHGVCRDYQEWKKEQAGQAEWLRQQNPDPSPRMISGANRKIREGRAGRRWKKRNGGEV